MERLVDAREKPVFHVKPAKNDVFERSVAERVLVGERRADRTEKQEQSEKDEPALPRQAQHAIRASQKSAEQDAQVRNVLLRERGQVGELDLDRLGQKEKRAEQDEDRRPLRTHEKERQNGDRHPQGERQISERTRIAFRHPTRFRCPEPPMNLRTNGGYVRFAPPRHLSRCSLCRWSERPGQGETGFGCLYSMMAGRRPSARFATKRAMPATCANLEITQNRA